MTKQAVLFDLDGTLIDSNDQHVLAWKAAFARHDIDLTTDAIHEQIGKGADLLVPALLPGVTEETAKAMGDAHDEIFKVQFLHQVKAFPKAHELLARVHEAGQAVVIASSASKADLEHYVDLLNARNLLAAATTIDDVKTSKPAPDIFATALKKVGCDPAAALAVGDSPYDVEAAGKCGIATLAVRSGKFGDEALLRAGAILLYDDVADVLADFENSPLGGSTLPN